MTGFITDKVKHLVTSGCSFTDNYGGRWPHYLSRELNAILYNWGTGSAGNDWACDSIIFQLSELLEQGIVPEKILCGVMWTGIDRSSLFVDDEMADWQEFFVDEPGSWNPVSWVNTSPNKHNKPSNIKNNAKHGWVLGSPSFKCKNDHILNYRKLHYENFFTTQHQAFQSINNWLKLQMFCETNNIKLFNLTYMNIMNYPHSSQEARRAKTQLGVDLGKVTKRYNSSRHLEKHLAFENWFFHNECEGMMEWISDNHPAEFEQDGVHPTSSGHELYVKEFLVPRLLGDKHD